MRAGVRATGVRVALRYFSSPTIEQLLARCGSRSPAEYGDFDKTPIRDDSAEMVFIAEPG